MSGHGHWLWIGGGWNAICYGISGLFNLVFFVTNKTPS